VGNVLLLYDCWSAGSNAPHYSKSASIVKGVPDIENPDNIPTLIVLDYFMDPAFSTKVSHFIYQGIASS